MSMDTLLNGEHWRATHRASVASLLGAAAPPVYSRGDRFYNVDRWTLLYLLEALDKWVRAHPGATPTLADVGALVALANARAPDPRHIVIASTPSRLTLRVAFALTGGGYHEALHTLHSRRRELTTSEVADILLPRWSEVGDWTALLPQIREWTAYAEDIRIERRGVEAFPGIAEKMWHLQDFILEQEASGRAAAVAQGKPDPLTRPLVVAQAAFRDLGLGYRTTEQRRALEGYALANPTLYRVVSEGHLRPLLDEAISLTAADDLGCLRVAVGVVVALKELALSPSEADSAVESTLALSDAAPAALLDASAALAVGFQQIRVREEGRCVAGERPWRPLDLSLDAVGRAPVEAGAEADLRRDRGAALKLSVADETRLLKTRLRSILLAVTQRGVVHGVRRGRDISDRTLAESAADLRAGMAPRRGFQAPTDAVDVSLAAVAMVDQSDSMAWGGRKQDAARCIVALAEAMEAVGGAVLVAGFRDNTPHTTAVPEGFHRSHGVRIDVIKTFTERVAPTLWRFSTLVAMGSTPMSDGIRYGLDALAARAETHRLLFVVTDGMPNGRDAPVVRYLTRTAAPQGVTVIGVGIGGESRPVMHMFPAHVWAQELKDMPALLVGKLNEVLDFRGGAVRRAGRRA